VLKATALGSGRVRIAAKKTSEMASTSKHNGRSGEAWALRQELSPNFGDGLKDQAAA